MESKGNKLICIAVVLAMLLMTAGVVTAKTITVDDSAGANYTSIYEAVNHSKQGDTILVHPGIYIENVNVYKSLTITSFSGDPEDTIVQAANPTDDVFEVTADNVTISGLTIRGESPDKPARTGILLDEADHNLISNNILENNHGGITVMGKHQREAHGNIIVNNILTNNGIGISLFFDSEDNYVGNNNASSNKGVGIGVQSSSHNIIENNIANSNNMHGIKLDTSSDNYVFNNTANSNNNGIYLKYANTNNTLEANTANSNRYMGIFIQGLGKRYSDKTSNNTIVENQLVDNLKGIYLTPDVQEERNHIRNNEIVNKSIWRYIYIFAIIALFTSGAAYLFMRKRTDGKGFFLLLKSHIPKLILPLAVASLLFLAVLVNEISILILPAAPLAYGWFTRHRIGSTLVGALPTIGLYLYIWFILGELYEVTTTSRIIESIFYFGSLTVVAGVEGYLASKGEKEHLMLAILLGIIWILILLSGID